MEGCRMVTFVLYQRMHWLNGHAPSHVEAEPREDGVNCGGTECRSGNIHSRASGETWHAVAADLASFNTCPPEDTSALRDDECEVRNQRDQESLDRYGIQHFFGRYKAGW